MGHHHLLVSPSPLYLIGLETVISPLEAGSVVYSSRTDEDAFRIYSAWPTDYIWWAYPFPIQKMISDIVRPVLAKNKKAKIILIQHAYSPEEIRELFKLGITGYLGLHFSIDDIIQAYESCKKGLTYIDLNTVKILSTNYLHNEKTIHTDQLTDREKQVLQLIVKGDTTREIAAHLHISKCTVETHRLHLIRKIGVKNTASLVREAMNLKLISASG